MRRHFKVAGAAFVMCSASFTSAQAPCSFEDMRGNGDVRWAEAFQEPLNAPYVFRYRDRAENLFFLSQRKSQWGQWWGGVEQNGHVALSIELQNDAVADGDHMAAMISLNDRNGRIVRDTSGQPLVVVLRAGLDAKSVCHATGRGKSCYNSSVQRHFQIDTRSIANVAYVEVVSGYWNTVDDGAFWINVESAATCYLGS